jgi:hypothetical protein
LSLKRILAVLALAVSGCALIGSSGPTEVARGEYYAAGKPEYDAFFIQLHQLQVELLAAPDDPRQVRESLTKAAGLTADASDDSLSSRLAQELKKLESRGLRVRLEIPEPSTVLDASATLHTSESGVSTPLRTSLPHDATRLVRSRNRMLATKAQLEKLRVNGVQLDANVDTAFRSEGPWKRDEVRRNLNDAQKVMTLMASRAQEVQELDQKLLSLVASATTTDPNLGKAPAYTPPPPAPEVAAPPKTAKRGSGRAGAAPRPATAPKPAAVPKPAPATKPQGGDEAAAPKPVQGNAPAEIEP